MWNALTGTLVSFAVSVVELFPESPFVVLNDMSNSDFYTWLRYLLYLSNRFALDQGD